MKPISKTVKLSRPIVAHGGNLNEITLKEPTCRQYRVHGEPWVVIPITSPDGDPDKKIYQTVWDNEKCLAFVEDITNVSIESLELMSANDWLAVRNALQELVYANPTA